jgi:hypothetical protein
VKLTAENLGLRKDLAIYYCPGSFRATSKSLVPTANLGDWVIVRRRSPNESRVDEQALVRGMTRAAEEGASTTRRHGQQHTRELEISQASDEYRSPQSDLRDAIQELHAKHHWTHRKHQDEAGSKSSAPKLATVAEREECQPLWTTAQIPQHLPLRAPQL